MSGRAGCAYLPASFEIGSDIDHELTETHPRKGKTQQNTTWSSLIQTHTIP